MVKQRILALALLIAVTLSGSAALFAQSAAPADAVLRALLEEVRALRISMQRSSAYELRGRFLIERARMHQEVIRELARELENAADFMRNSESDRSYEHELAMVEANVESRAAGIPNPEERKKMLERHKEAMERRKEMEAKHREQTRMRFQRMETRLAEEREKLRQIEEELAQMQRELTNAAAPAAP